MRKYSLTGNIILAFYVIFALINLPQYVSAAEYTFVRATSDNTYIYKVANELEDDKLFCLEYSYYAKVIGTQSQYYVVEIGDNNENFVKLTGYVKISSVQLIETIPAMPLYPTIKISINSTSADLKTSPSGSSSTAIAVLSSQKLNYYGKLTNNEATWYFVRHESGAMGYIKASAVNAFSIPLHPTPLPTIEIPDDPTPEDPVPEPEPPLDSTQILLILLICIPCAIIIVLIFVPSKNSENVREVNKPLVATTTVMSKYKPKYSNDDDLSDYDLL